VQAEIGRRHGGLGSRIGAVRVPPSRLLWPTVALTGGLALGAAVARGQTKFAILPMGVLIALVVARIPVAGYVGILWSVGTAVDVLALPEIGISSLQFVPAEVLLWISLGCLPLLARDVRRQVTDLACRRESIAVAAFLTAVLGGVAVGVENGASFHAALFDARYMLFYAAFWPALAAFARGYGLVFRLVCVGVILVVVLQASQVVIGPSTHMFLIASSDLKSSLTADGTGFLRVRPPGLTTVYVVAAFALARVLWGPKQRRAAVWCIALVSLTGVVLSLNRNMVLGLILGLSAAALVAKRRHRVIVMATVLALALSAVVLIAQDSAIGSNPVASRFATITNYSALRTQTLNDRYYENGIAMQRIRAHPIAGLGWGPTYGAVSQSYDDGFVVTTPRTFMHEQYLWIWMRAGIAGLIALLAMLAFGILTGVRWCRARGHEEDGWLGAGVVVSLVALAASSNVAIYLTPPDSTVPLVGVVALAAYMRRQLTAGQIIAE